MQSETPIEGGKLKGYANKFRGSVFKMYIPAVSASLLLLILGQILRPGFARLSNIDNLLSMATILAMATLGQTLIIISGKEGIDLSVGAMMSMGALLGVEFAHQATWGLAAAIVLLALIGGVAGLINALAIQQLGIPPLVMTLAMTSVVNGFSLAYTQGLPTGSVPDVLLKMGNGYLGPVRILLVFGLAIVVIVELVLRKTRYGRNLYLCGSNRRTAQLSGISVNSVVYLTYVLAGIIGAIGGLVLLGYAGSAQLGMGNDYTLLSIAAVVIGGTALVGGEGTFTGSYLGSIVLIILSSVLLAVGLPSGVRELIQGLILLLILAVYSRAPKLRQ